MNSRDIFYAIIAGAVIIAGFFFIRAFFFMKPGPTKIIFRNQLYRTISVTVYDEDEKSTDLTIKRTQIACAMSPKRITKARLYVPGVADEVRDLTYFLTPDGKECVDITWDAQERKIVLEPVFEVCPAVRCQWTQPFDQKGD